MNIVDLASVPPATRDAAAQLLVSEFDAPSGWRDLGEAREEVERIINEGFARAACDGEQLLGWAGGLPEYQGHVWELHPVVVHREYRDRGIGSALVAAIEREASRRGGLTLTLGTDDDALMTSVGGIDLYPDVLEHLRRLTDMGRRHPFLFYQRLGFAVTGIVPDANGPGKPDIYMSKRLTMPS